MRLPHHPHMNSRSKRDWAALWEFFADEMVGLQSLYLKLLMLHDTQEQIRRTEDAEGAEWIWPMVGMAAAVSGGGCDWCGGAGSREDVEESCEY